MPVHNLRVARVIQGINGGIAWIVICLVFIIAVPSFRKIRAKLTGRPNVSPQRIPAESKD